MIFEDRIERMVEKATDGWSIEDFHRADKALANAQKGLIFVEVCGIAFLLGKRIGFGNGLEQGFKIGEAMGWRDGAREAMSAMAHRKARWIFR